MKFEELPRIPLKKNAGCIDSPISIFCEITAKYLSSSNLKDYSTNFQQIHG
jgi:hypothetical protein